ncbi:MAG: hypothetical protein J3Q66DRAFT_353196 [Benniella sp.]|nr:MAG: hypothetical protein J3Q66DRAFT_353196 [Benniella sp.]
MEQGDSAINRRNLLFNVNQPFEVPTEEFHKEWWPLVSNVWAKTSTNYRSNGDSWTIHACRLSKPYRSSTRKDGIPNDKRRKTHARAAVPCEASIKITHVVSTKKTRVERYKSTPDHSHTLDDVDKIKRPAALRELIEEQVWKDYSPPEIVAIVKEVAQRKGLGEIAMHLHRDEVANIQRKYRASASAATAAATVAAAGGADGGQLISISKNRSRNTTDAQEDHGSTNSESYRHERVKNVWLPLSDDGSGPSTRQQQQQQQQNENDQYHHAHHHHQQHHHQQQEQQEQQEQLQGQFHVLVPTPPCYPRRLDEIMERLRSNFQSVMERGEDHSIRTFLQDLEHFVDAHSVGGSQ